MKAQSKEEKKNLNFSIRVGIVALLASLILFSSVLVLMVSYLGGKDSVHHLANLMMKKNVEYVLAKTVDYLKPAASNAEMLSKYLPYSNLLAPENREELSRLFIEIIAANDQLVMLYFGDRTGNFTMAKKMPDQTISIKMITREEAQANTVWKHKDAIWENSLPNIQEPSELAYDPRKRPWYIKAAEEGKTIWTSVYVFFTDKKPGISSATPVYDPSGKLIGVVGLDIGISELSLFLGNLKVGASGKAFIINQKNHLIAMPISESKNLERMVQKYTIENQEKYQLLNGRYAPDPVIAAISQKFPEKLLETSLVYDQFGFIVKGENYLGFYQSFPQGSSFPWLVGITVPEKDFMNIIDENNQNMIILSIVLIFVTLSLGVWLSKRISRPLSLLSQEMEKIKDFELDSKIEISSHLTEVNLMAHSFEGMKKGLRSFQKYVPAGLVRQLVSLGQEARLGGEKQTLTLLFLDITNFTKITEMTPPQDLVDRLGEFFNEVSRIIHEHRGIVDKYIGDEVMAFWGAPLYFENYALLACQAALRSRDRLTELARVWEETSIPPFHFRIGLNTGEAIVGNMGSEERMSYTAIGDSVNLASRLEELNKIYGTKIIISEYTYKLVKNHMEVRLLDLVIVRGKTEEIKIYELICEKGQFRTGQQEFIERFNEGMGFYLSRKWSRAQKKFQQALILNSEDTPSHLFIARCESYLLDEKKAEES